LNIIYNFKIFIEQFGMKQPFLLFLFYQFLTMWGDETFWQTCPLVSGVGSKG